MRGASPARSNRFLCVGEVTRADKVSERRLELTSLKWTRGGLATANALAAAKTDVREVEQRLSPRMDLLDAKIDLVGIV